MMKGKVRSGKGDGKYYIGMDVYQDRFREVLGYSPFPGTLNIEVDVEERRELEESLEGKAITEVYRDGERLSDVTVFPCKVEEKECAALRLEKTDHPESILELISPHNLREMLGLEDDDTVEITKE